MTNRGEYISYSEIGPWRKKNSHYIFRASVNKNDITAASRLKSGEFVSVFNEPKFTFTKNDKFFSIGSCFARNIEEVLINHGVHVLTKEIDINPDYYVTLARPNAVLNKYSTHSIESEIVPTLLGKPPESLIQINEKTWFDPLSSHIKPNSYEIIHSIRKKVSETTKKLTDSDAVFITLGQNEAWFDREQNIFLNAAPPPQAMRKYQDRFSVYFPNFEENITALRNVIDSILKYANKKMKIIVTVSPIPMGVTLSKQDAFSANLYSKSVLRVCADQLMKEYSQVDYFPSYEMAIYSPRDMAWEADEVHVKKDLVEFITSVFIERYFIP